MLNQFTDEYKQIMLDAENRVKKFGYREILPEDVLIQISKIQKGNVYDLFVSFGINDSILTDVLTRPPFAHGDGVRAGDYVGISQRLKELIVLSMKVAASFQKSQAGTEDFLLALFRSENETWFFQLLDFIGVTPKDFEAQVIEINKLIANIGGGKGQTSGIFGPIDEIMNMIEDTFGNNKNPQNPNQVPPQNPFSQNPPQEKRESQTPALDFF
jgi:ATP-dependent Clp protease ATP-binding subunit ClpA